MEFTSFLSLSKKKTKNKKTPTTTTTEQATKKPQHNHHQINNQKPKPFFPLLAAWRHHAIKTKMISVEEQYNQQGEKCWSRENYHPKYTQWVYFLSFLSTKTTEGHLAIRNGWGKKHKNTWGVTSKIIVVYWALEYFVYTLFHMCTAYIISMCVKIYRYRYHLTLLQSLNGFP